MLGRRLLAQLDSGVLLEPARLERDLDGDRLVYQGADVRRPWQVVDLDTGEIVARGPFDPPYVSSPGLALAVRLRP